VAAGYQVVVPDYRGAGASTKPRDGYDKWTMAGDLHDLVRNELGIDGPIWHFDFHANPDIAVYLTHGRERWYITRVFDDLTYQPDAITQNDLDIYARAFEAPGAIRALCEIYRQLDHDAAFHRTDIAANGKLTVPVLASGGGAQTLAPNTRRCARRSPSMSRDT
jgi:hypothetical protein